jgi:hypothetical protein
LLVKRSEIENHLQAMDCVALQMKRLECLSWASLQTFPDCKRLDYKSGIVGLKAMPLMATVVALVANCVLARVDPKCPNREFPNNSNDDEESYY